MNFDKNHVAHKKSIPTGTRIFRRISLTALKIFLVLLLFCVILGTAAGVGMIKGLIASAPNIDSLSVAPAESATYIYNTGNKPVQKLAESTSNRILVKLDQIPEDLQHAIVAVEDERFYKHHGIDIQGIARAAVIGITSGDFSEGASTITQQLIKNNVFTDWVTQTALSQKLRRKFQEQYLALQLEKKMSKDQILQDYLNTINLGASSYGVQAAAKRYFNKDVSQLNLSESTVIAGITQNPTLYNPIINPDENAKRRKIILQKMVDQGYISEQQQQDALADDVYSRIQKTAQETDEVSIYSYYTDALIEQVMDDLVEVKGYTRQQAYKAVYSGGLKIYSNQDEEIQKICDEEFANPENYPSVTLIGLDYALSIQKSDGEIINYSSEMLRSWFQKQDSSFNMMFDDEESAKAAAETYKNAMVKKGDTVLGERVSLVPQPQASVVIIDNETGYVKAIVGGRGEKEASLTLNRATETRRQPGSTFKIVSTYAPALDAENMTLATVFDNAPYNYTNGVPVNNWAGKNAYTGLTTIRQAIAGSINVVAVKCLTEITPRLGFEYAEALGISTLYDDENLDVRQPLALGGITDGVVNIELCDAYATIANGGKYNEAKFYSRIEDSEGKVIIDNTPEEKTVLKDSTAFLLTQAMMDVVKAGGTASDVSLGEMPIAGKTGTTSDDRDIWFAAYSPYYTCTVWGGYDNHDTLPSGDLYHTYHKKLWTAIMSRIHENLPVRQFEQPDSVETAYVCKKSGLLAVDGVCTGDPRGSMAYTEYFAKGTTPTKSCDVHTAVKVCSSTGLLPTATCTTTTKIFVKRPAGSEGTTEDSAYAPPSATCKGHNILDKITDILNPKKDAADMDADDSKKDGATTPGSDANSGSTTTPDSNSGSGDSSGSGGTGSGTGSGSGGSTSGGGSGGDSGGTTAPGGDDILEIIP